MVVYKFVQICDKGGRLYALDSEGVVWVYSPYTLGWAPMPSKRLEAPLQDEESDLRCPSEEGEGNAAGT